MVIHSWLFTPALPRSHFSQSFHLSLGLPLWCLSPSSECPFCQFVARVLPISFCFQVLSWCVFSHSSHFSQLLRLPSVLSSYSTLTQLFSLFSATYSFYLFPFATHICTVVSCRLRTLPLRCFFTSLSHLVLSSLFHAAIPAYTLFSIYLLSPPVSHNCP